MLATKVRKITAALRRIRWHRDQKRTKNHSEPQPVHALLPSEGDRRAIEDQNDVSELSPARSDRVNSSYAGSVDASRPNKTAGTRPAILFIFESPTLSYPGSCAACGCATDA